ncbi:MAG: redoxin domain-containing protein [Bryobacteraceae bacterium]
MWLARLFAVLALAGVTAFARGSSLPLDLSGHPVDVFAAPPRIRVLVFVRTDCPISDRYAPELHRIADEFHSSGVAFWLVYPDPTEAPAAIARHLSEYRYGWPALRDPEKVLVKRARVTVAPEAAVFNASGVLVYHGRIDDRVVDFGKSRPSASDHNLEDAITATLNGKAVAKPITRAIGCFLADLE